MTLGNMRGLTPVRDRGSVNPQLTASLEPLSWPHVRTDSSLVDPAEICDRARDQMILNAVQLTRRSPDD
jgi:hypothetical protein